MSFAWEPRGTIFTRCRYDRVCAWYHPAQTKRDRGNNILRFARVVTGILFSDTEKAGSLREHWEFQQPMAVIQLSRGCRFPSPVVAEQSLEVLTTSIETADRLAIAKSATANGELYRMKFSRQSLILSRKVGNTKRLPSR